MGERCFCQKRSVPPNLRASPPRADMSSIQVDYFDSAILSSDPAFLSIGDITCGLDMMDCLHGSDTSESTLSPWGGRWTAIKSLVWAGKHAPAAVADAAVGPPCDDFEKRGTPTASARSSSSWSGDEASGDDTDLGSVREEQPSQGFSGQLSSLLVHTALFISRISLNSVAAEDSEDGWVQAQSIASVEQPEADFDVGADSECSFRDEVAASLSMPYDEEMCGASCPLAYRRLSMHERHRQIEHLGDIFKIPCATPL